MSIDKENLKRDSSPKEISSYWGEDFFNLLYWRLFMKRSASTCMSQASSILTIAQKHLDLAPFSDFSKSSSFSNTLGNIQNAQGHPLKKLKVLDTCAGVSDIAMALSHILELKDVSHSLDTIELIKDYVSVALDQESSITPYQGDVFKFLEDSNAKYDLITNWYSSFGYFSPEQNADFLRLAICALKSEGVFILECPNSLKVKESFSPVFSYTQTDPLTLETYSIERCSEIQELSSLQRLENADTLENPLSPFARLNQTWSYKNKNNNLSDSSPALSYDTYSYMYGPQTLLNIIASFNLNVETTLYSSPDSGDMSLGHEFILNSFNPDDKRIIIVCKKL